MKKLILFTILLACVNSYAINGFSIFKMYSQYDTVTHTNLDSNLNRPASWSSLLVDTLDKKFIRFYDLSSHDSTLPYVAIDSIRSNPNLDSTQGNVRHAGKYTFTDSINGTNIKLTGRGTGTDFEASDSIKSQTGSFSSAVSTSLVSSDSIANTGGIKSQSFWAYNNTSEGSYIGLFKGLGFLPGNPTYRYPVLKTDFQYMYFSSNEKFIGTIGPEYFTILDTGSYSVPFKFAVNRDTAYFNTHLGIMTNTPQYPLHVVGGANAYTTYAIGSSTTGQSFGSKVQAGTNASDQAFGVYSYAGLPYFTIRGDGLPAFWLGLEVAGGANIDSLKINNGDYLRVYDTCLFACSLYTDESSSGGVYLGLTGTGRAERIGNTVTLSFPTFAETSLSVFTDAATVQCVLPTGFCPVDATTSYRCDFATWSSGATNTLKIAPVRSKFNNSTGATAIRITGASESGGQRLVVGYSTSTSQDGVVSSQRWTINYKID